MYLVSIYFDENSSKEINKYITKCALSSQNTFMIDHHVPAHMTLLAFQSDHEEKVIELLKQYVKDIKSEEIYFTSIGAFLPHVLYISPLLNEYLFKTQQFLYDGFKDIDTIKLSYQYKPYSWIPHTTIAKTLSQEELNKSFKTMQSLFNPFHAKVTRIALSKTNPYQDIISFDLY